MLQIDKLVYYPISQSEGGSKILECPVCLGVSRLSVSPQGRNDVVYDTTCGYCSHHDTPRGTVQSYCYDKFNGYVANAFISGILKDGKYMIDIDRNAYPFTRYSHEAIQGNENSSAVDNVFFLTKEDAEAHLLKLKSKFEAENDIHKLNTKLRDNFVLIDQCKTFDIGYRFSNIEAANRKIAALKRAIDAVEKEKQRFNK